MTSIENILQERKGYWIKILKKTSKPDWLNIDSPQIQKYDVIYGDDSEYRGKEYYLDFEEEKIIKEWEDKDDKKKKYRDKEKQKRDKLMRKNLTKLELKEMKNKNHKSKKY